MLRFFVEKQIDHFLRGHDPEFARIELARLPHDLAQHVIANRPRRLDLPLALADRARLAKHMRERFPRALARHFDEPELGETVHRRTRTVARERLLQLAEHGIAMFSILHVDEVDDDDAAQVSQP